MSLTESKVLHVGVHPPHVAVRRLGVIDDEGRAADVIGPERLYSIPPRLEQLLPQIDVAPVEYSGAMVQLQPSILGNRCPSRRTSARPRPCTPALSTARLCIRPVPTSRCPYRYACQEQEARLCVVSELFLPEGSERCWRRARQARALYVGPTVVDVDAWVATAPLGLGQDVRMVAGEYRLSSCQVSFTVDRAAEALHAISPSEVFLRVRCRACAAVRATAQASSRSPASSSSIAVICLLKVTSVVRARPFPSCSSCVDRWPLRGLPYGRRARTYRRAFS